MNTYKYIKTDSGIIHKDDIPVIIEQSTMKKIQTAAVFFAIGIIIIVILLIIPRKTYTQPFVSKSEVFSNDLNCTQYSVPMHSISIYKKGYLPLENVVLIDDKNSVYNIDLIRNKNVTFTQNKGISLYNIKLNDELMVKEIILISNVLYKIGSVNIESFSESNKLSWRFSGTLTDSRENSIRITKFKQSSLNPPELLESLEYEKLPKLYQTDCPGSYENYLQHKLAMDHNILQDGYVF